MKALGIILNSNAYWIILSLIVTVLVNIILIAHKYKLVLKEAGIEVPFKVALFMRLGNIPLNTLLPMRTGKIFSIIYLKKKFKLSIKRGLSSELFNTFIDIAGLFIFIIIGLPMVFMNSSISNYYIYFLIIPILIIIVSFSLKIKLVQNIISFFAKKISNNADESIRELLHLFQQTPILRTIILISYSALIQLGIIFFYWIILKAVGVSAGAADIFIFIPLIVFAAILPITVSGIGVRESLLIVLLTKVASAEALFGTGMLISAIGYIFPAMLGLIFLRRFLRATFSKD